MKLTNSSLFLILCCVFLPISSLAAPGDLDPTFMSGGFINPSADLNVVSDVVAQPDGKIVTVGTTGSYGSFDFFLARFNSNGTPDSTFGSGGKVVTSVAAQDGATKIALQSDGKIVAVGYAGTPGVSDVAVIRYNADGTLDTTFDNDGIVILSRQPVSESATGVVIQTDGRIVVGGYTEATSGDFFLARFNTNGALDLTFGTGGLVVTDIRGGYDFAKDLVMQTDGKLVAVGTSRIGDSGDFAAVRYLSNGSVDNTFGTNGKVITPVGSDNDDAVAAEIQPDGKIVVIGAANTGGNSSNPAIVRYNTGGELDTTFGNGGKVIDTNYSQLFGNDLKIQSNGKIIFVGSRYNGATSDIAIARYNSAGSIDTTFGNNGIVFQDINGSRDVATSVVMQGADKIIVAGGSYNSSEPFKSSLVALRYSANNKSGFDFDGDGKSDLSVFRPSNGNWYVQQSQNGFSGTAFGIESDRIVSADYDGDGKTDIAVNRSGSWYLQRSAEGFTAIQFGDANDIPVPADYDGDGKADVAVFRPSNGTWYILNLVNNQFISIPFGLNGDKPVPADYDGDGKADVAVNRGGNWYVQRSQLGFTGILFGEATDKLVPADYDGDGKADVAVFRPSNGTWYLLQSQAGFKGLNFGLGTDIPVAADYDGDGKADVAVVRNGNWYLQRTTQGFAGILFGNSNDKPIPNSIVR